MVLFGINLLSTFPISLKVGAPPRVALASDTDEAILSELESVFVDSGVAVVAKSKSVRGIEWKKAKGRGIATESAGVILLADEPARVIDAVLISRRTMKIARQSIVVGLGLSGIGMVGAAIGLIPPVAGALLQEGIDLAVILNALRASTSGRGGERPVRETPVDVRLPPDRPVLAGAVPFGQEPGQHRSRPGKPQEVPR
jgi:hypothetical protein